MSAWGASGAAIGAMMLVAWLLSLALKDASVVDSFWGMGFVLVAWVGYFLGPRAPTGLALALLVTAWGLRLSVYLAMRAHGKPEDHRYRAMRERIGPRFPLVSLVSVFALQGAVMWVVALPLHAASEIAAPFTSLHGAGFCAWALGLFFEAIGDAQLARFKRDPSHAGKVMDRGLWRYTRHPNYFGDFLVWWGLFAFAWASGAPAWTALGPVVMSVFLMRISGVTLLEKTLRARPGYQEYVRRTSAFFPWPPRA